MLSITSAAKIAAISNKEFFLLQTPDFQSFREIVKRFS